MPPETSQVLNGRYRLLEIVGEGGMAVVWRAEDVLLGRTVAVKLLRDQYAADPDFVDRFRSEARSAAALNDPGIVGVYDVGDDGGRHYLVMEFVAGQDLKTIIRDEAPLAPDRAVRIGAAVARAVAAAHASGLVHRDIKPQNVLVTADGRMKVADFGIARAVSAIGNTAPGIVLGTVHYLSPEQAVGGPATFASDVYALGVVLYEMLSGRVPFDADSAVGVAMKIAHEAPEPLARLNARVPAILVNIVDRSMAHDPAARYPDAKALADALDSYARWSEQATGGLAAATGVAGAAALGGAPSKTGQPPKPPQPAAPRPPAARPGGPLLDWTGLTLGLVALAAVAGLIPLWMAVVTRPGQTQAGSFSGFISHEQPGQTPTPTPTPAVAGDVSGPDVSVPQVVGMKVEDATRMLAGQSLGVTTEFTTTRKVAAGQVVEQSPAADLAVPQGTVVRLVVNGRALVNVPALYGDYAAQAAAIEQMGLVPRRVEQWGGADTAVGAVIGLKPQSGTRVAKDSAVDVIVNSGSWRPLGVDFADHIHLTAISVPRDTLRPGDQLAVGMRWEAVEAVSGDYVASVVLIGPGGDAVASAEHTPGGDRPTNTWQAGEHFADDTFNLVVPPTLAPGTYSLAVDLHSRDNPDKRIDVLKNAYATTSGTRVEVMPITVMAQ